MRTRRARWCPAGARRDRPTASLGGPQRLPSQLRSPAGHHPPERRVGGVCPSYVDAGGGQPRLVFRGVQPRRRTGQVDAHVDRLAAGPRDPGVAGRAEQLQHRRVAHVDTGPGLAGRDAADTGGRRTEGAQPLLERRQETPDRRPDSTAWGRPRAGRCIPPHGSPRSGAVASPLRSRRPGWPERHQLELGVGVRAGGQQLGEVRGVRLAVERCDRQTAYRLSLVTVVVSGPGSDEERVCIIVTHLP